MLSYLEFYNCCYGSRAICLVAITISWMLFSGVGSNCALRGSQIQVVGVALIIEFCDHNIPFLKVVL